MGSRQASSNRKQVVVASPQAMEVRIEIKCTNFAAYISISGWPSTTLQIKILEPMAMLTDQHSVQQATSVSWDLMPEWKNTIAMLTDLHAWNIRYCKRSANAIADSLAKFDSLVVQTFRANGQDDYLLEQKQAKTYSLGAFCSSTTMQVHVQKLPEQ